MALASTLARLRSVMESGRFDPSEPPDDYRAWRDFDRWYKKTGKHDYSTKRQAEQAWKRGNLPNLGQYPGRRVMESTSSLAKQTKLAMSATLAVWNLTKREHNLPQDLWKRYSKAYDELEAAYEELMRMR